MAEHRGRAMSGGSDEFAAFLVTLKDERSRTALSPRRLTEALGLPVETIANLARVHRRTIDAFPISTRLQKSMGEVIRVLSAAHSLGGDLASTLRWFRCQSIPELGDYTPIQLVEQDKAQALIDYLSSIRSGSVG